MGCSTRYELLNVSRTRISTWLPLLELLLPLLLLIISFGCDAIWVCQSLRLSIGVYFVHFQLHTISPNDDVIRLTGMPFNCVILISCSIKIRHMYTDTLYDQIQPNSVRRFADNDQCENFHTSTHTHT